MKNNLKYFAILLAFFMFISFSGLLMNYTAKFYNNGKMPVKFDSYSFETNRHFSYSNKEEVNFWFLSDIYPASFGTFSIGDYFLFLGAIGSLFTFLFMSLHIFLVLKNNIFPRPKGRGIYQ